MQNIAGLFYTDQIMKRVRLATALPFVLGIFIGTMITSFLLLAVQSIDEELPAQQSIAVELDAGHSEGETLEPEEEGKQSETESFSQSQLASFNVLTSQISFTEQSFAIHRTWGGEKDIQGNIEYYVYPRAEKEELDFSISRKMPVTSLETSQDKEMQEDGRGTFQLWKNICTKKQGQYLWFVKVRDNVYLRRKRLASLLSSLNSSEALFVGNAIFPSGNKREDLGLREGESYCHEGCYILSQKALQLLCSKLETCQENVRSTNEDVEIARCMRKHFGVNCTSATEMKELFYSAESITEQEELQTGDHKFNDKIKPAIILSPLNKPEHFYSMHHYYTNLLLESVNKNNTKLRAHVIQTAERGAQSDSLLRSSEHQSPPWTKLGVNLPYKPSDPEEDVIHFQPSDGYFVYTESKHNPKYPISHDERSNIDKMFKAVVKSQQTYGSISNTSSVLLENTLQRIDPQRGTDYFLEVVIKDKEGFVSTKFLHGLQELVPVQVTSLSDADYKSTKVNFIVATPPVSHGFQRFMMSFENSFLARKPTELVGMLVIMYSDKVYRTTEKDLFSVSTLINLYRNKYPEADLRLITINNKYSRIDMLKTASEQYPSYELLFLADIHIDFSTQFLERCRMNTYENKQVYFPAAFNPYDPLEFYKERILYPYTTKFQISSNRGSWMQNSYHLACVYNNDLVKILDGEGRGGDEKEGDYDDWSLVDHFIKQNQLKIFRSVEPGLVHMWQDGCKEVEQDSPEAKLCQQLEIAS